MEYVNDIEEMKTKLGQVFDLERVSDCHRVIESLIRSLKYYQEESFAKGDDLRRLAIKVMAGNPEMIELAKKAIRKDKKSDKDMFDFLVGMVGEMEEACKMSDRELIDEVTEKVWSIFESDSEESAVLGEMISRMRSFIVKKK